MHFILTETTVSCGVNTLPQHVILLFYVAYETLA